MATAFNQQQGNNGSAWGDSGGLDWQEALREFLLHQEATRASSTVHFYRNNLSQFIRWAEENQVGMLGFGKRHLDRYLAQRLRDGRAQMTARHDAVSIKAFFKWCQRNDIIERSLLEDYEIRRAPYPPRHMPTDEEIRTLLGVLHDYWNVEKNPDIRFNSPAKRVFHRDRNYAIILGLLDCAARINEILSLKMTDYQAENRQILIRESKGREPRALPISNEWAEALAIWLKVRQRIMSNVPKDQDEGWLFISETGTRPDSGHVLKVLKKNLAITGQGEKITLHSLRRYSLNRLAKTNLLAAQAIVVSPR